MDYYGADTKLVDLVFSNYRLLPVLKRLGVQLGFGEMTVGEFCQEKGIDVGFFLAIVNLYNDKDLISEEAFLKYPLQDLITFLVNSHDYYKKEVIAKHHDLFKQMKDNTLKGIDGIDRIYDLYNKELKEFLAHMDYEDKVVYPYLLGIEGKKCEKEDGYNILKNIDDFHTGLMEELYDMKSILLKYLVCKDDVSISNELLFSIFEFAEDLDIHSKIENSILLRYIKK